MEKHVVVSKGDAKRIDFRLQSSVLETWSKKEDLNIADNIAAVDILEKDIGKSLDEIVSSSDIATQSVVSAYVLYYLCFVVD